MNLQANTFVNITRDVSGPIICFLKVNIPNKLISEKTNLIPFTGKNICVGKTGYHMSKIARLRILKII